MNLTGNWFPNGGKTESDYICTKDYTSPQSRCVYSHWSLFTSITHDLSLTKLFFNDKKRLRCFNFGTAIACAAKNGNLPVVKWLHSKHLCACHNDITDELDDYPIDYAAENGHLEIVKWLHKYCKKGRTSWNALSNAAVSGHLEVVEWLDKHRYEKGNAIYDALEADQVQVVNWFHENYPNRLLKAVVYCTKDNKKCNHTDIDESPRVAKWIYENYHDQACSKYLLDRLAEFGYLELLQSHQKICSRTCTSDAMDLAAGNGHLGVVKWLHETSSRTERCTTDAMDYAIENGHIDVVKWLHENRSEGYTMDGITKAIQSGRIDTVTWLMSSQKKLNSFTY